MATTLNFKGQWDNTWGSIESALGPNVVKFVGIVGMLLVVSAVISYIWTKRKGGGDTSKVIWTLAIGALLTAPNLISVILLFVDAIGNVLIKLVGA